jgi:hypothetical protein
MRKLTELALGSMSLAVFVALCWLLGLPISAGGQTGKLGQNAVCTTTPCSQASQTVGTWAFVDAYVVSTKLSSPNFCSVLNDILTTSNGFLTSTGGVVDARGLNSANVNMTCSASPWSGINVPPPSVILLPATTATAPIVIPSAWVLPPNTHVIGQGDNVGFGTTLQACKSSVNGCSFTDTAMLQFGLSSLCTTACTGIAVENLNLDGQGQAINGIVNVLSQDLSYVDHVSLYQILGTGLSVSGSANNSGPYSNITFDTGSYATFLSVAERQSTSPPNRAATSGVGWKVPAISKLSVLPWPIDYLALAR